MTLHRASLSLITNQSLVSLKSFFGLDETRKFVHLSLVDCKFMVQFNSIRHMHVLPDKGGDLSLTVKYSWQCWYSTFDLL